MAILRPTEDPQNPAYDDSDILLCLENPKIGGVDDVEIVGDRTQKMAQFFGTSSRRKYRTDRQKSL
jgi:hypothetical protein